MTVDLTLPAWVRSRDDWGARPTDPRRPLQADPLPWPRLWAHHTAGSMWATPADIQRLHQVTNGWRDAAYNFYVRMLRSGGVEVGELLGLHRHLNSDAGHSGTILWVGNYDTTPVPDALIEAGARLVAHGVLAGWWSDELRDEPHLTGGHRDIPGADPTACPGRHLHARLPEINTRARQMIRDLKEADMSTTPPLVAGHDGQGRWWRFKPGSDFGVEVSEVDARALVSVTPGAKIVGHDTIEMLKRTNALVTLAGRIER